MRTAPTTRSRLVLALLATVTLTGLLVMDAGVGTPRAAEEVAGISTSPGGPPR